MAEHKSDSMKFICNGMVLNLVSDLRPQGKFNFLQNIRVVTEGILEGRPRLDTFLTLTGAAGVTPHTIKTIIDKSAGTFLRIIGAGTNVHTGNGLALPIKSGGYSGKPLYLVDFRPEAAVEAYIYIADENKFEKISVSNILSPVGLTAPKNAAAWQIGKPERKIIDAIETGSDAAWNNLTGSAAAPTLEDRVDTTITKYLADGALPSFASIVPAALTADLQKDSIIVLNASESVIVEEVLPAALATGIATISKITYDAGATGSATIVLSVPVTDLKRNSILLLNAAEYVRVTDVTLDDNNIPSVRVNTVGTFAAGQSVSGVASFRFYATVGYVPTNAIKNKAIKTVISAAGISSISRVFNVDLSNTGTKPLSDDDILHCSLKVSNPAAISEIQIQLDINSGAQNFSENYFYYVVNPNFFTASAQQTTPTISVIQQTLQRQQILQARRQAILNRYDSGGYGGGQYFPYNINPDLQNSYLDYLDSQDQNQDVGTVGQTTLGQSQWTELNFKLSDLKRAGSDNSRTLRDVKAIRISVNATAAVDIQLDSLWVGGADALDSVSTQGFLPYNYVWRVRDPATNNRSNWSPPFRSDIKISRGRVVLTFPNALIDYPATYKIDIARFGGSLNDFRLVGSIDNDGSSYTDTSSDRLIADNALAGRYEGQGAVDAVFDFYKPFAILDKPKKGTCDVVGTKWVWKTGDKLNITYPRGTQIIINGKANKFYSSPADDQHVELENDMGALTNVVFELKAPLLTGQPLPVVFGPFGEGNFGLIIFGIGDKNAAGTLYWLDGNSPDTMSDLNSLEITSPSEPLMSGVMYDGYGQVYTTRRSFTLIPTYNGEQFGFIARENANSRGIFCRTGLTVGRNYIYFLSENADGIYRVQGNGNPESITAVGMDNLFYNNGKAPSQIVLVDGTTIDPPDFTAVDDIRLFYTKDYLYFRFKDIAGKDRCLVFDDRINDWISYDTFPNDKINVFYHEESESTTQVLAGINNGVAKFATAPATSFEDATAVRVLPFTFDAGDARLIKLFKEAVINVIPGTFGLSYKVMFDFNSLSATYAGQPGVARQEYIVDIEFGHGRHARNVTIRYDWLLRSGTKLIEQKIYFIPQGDDTKDRASDIENGGDLGAKLWQGVVIQANTYGVDKELRYFDDQEIERALITINTPKMQTVSRAFDIPFISHTIKRISFDAVKWVPLQEVYVFDKEPESATVWEGEFNTSDLAGLLLIKRFGIAYRSTAAITFRLFSMDSTEEIYSLPSSAGLWHKEFFFARQQKTEGYKYRLESEEPVRFYKKDCEIWIKSVNSPQPFVRINPFGGLSRISEILI